VRSLKTLAALLGVGVFTTVGVAETEKTEQAVIVNFDYGSKDWNQFFAFEKGFESAVNASGLGDYDGNELAVDGSDGSMYMYGPDADRLFAFVRPRLEAAAFLKHVRVTLRYGSVDDPKAREVVVKLGS